VVHLDEEEMRGSEGRVEVSEKGVMASGLGESRSEYE
jgi:hypothetical protein